MVGTSQEEALFISRYLSYTALNCFKEFHDADASS